MTLRSLETKLRQIDEIEVSKTSLQKILKTLNFSWKTCIISNRKFLMEQTYVVHKRIEFLREFKMNQTSGLLKPVVLDETWIFSKGAFRKSWQDGSLNTVRKTSGEGAR